MAELRIFQQGALPGSKTLYNQNGNVEYRVWLADDNLADNAFGVGVGKYDFATAAWSFWGPDGQSVELVTNDGTDANPARFTPTLPGRYLVRLVASPHTLDPNTLGPEEVFTCLLEILDPQVIGHPSSDGEYGSSANADERMGTSLSAANETNEYDSDEGWSRSIERYLTVISKSLGFRQLLTTNITEQNGISAGQILTPTADFFAQWKGVDADLENFGNFVIQAEKADIGDPDIMSKPLFVALHDAGQGERCLSMVRGVIPYNTTNMNTGDSVFVGQTGDLVNVEPNGPNDTVRVVGSIIYGQADQDDNPPGSVFFDGASNMTPGVVSGPSSTDLNRVAIWNNATGTLLDQGDWTFDEGILSYVGPEAFALMKTQSGVPIKVPVDFEIDGKLTVTGLIDPTGLALAQDPGDTHPDATIYVSDGSDGFGAGELIYKRAALDLVPLSVGSGGVNAPQAGSMEHEIAMFTDATGASIEGTGLQVNMNLLVTNGAPNTVELAATAVDDGFGGGGTVGQSLVIGPAEASGGQGGALEIRGGDADSGLPPGSTTVIAGSSSDLTGFGGDAHVKGGAGDSGGSVHITAASSETTGGAMAGSGMGGSVHVSAGTGGHGSHGGGIQLSAGGGANFEGNGNDGGAGGNVTISAGSAGTGSSFMGGSVTINAGMGGTLADGSLGGNGGDVSINAGETGWGQQNPNSPPRSPGNVEITAGKADSNSGSDGGSVVINPGASDDAGQSSGNVEIANGVDFQGAQKGRLVVGSPAISGLADKVINNLGMDFHSFHGDVAITGILDPLGLLMAPTAENPIRAAVQANGLSEANFEAEIKNAVWLRSGAEPLLMIGDEPARSRGNIVVDQATVAVDGVGDLDPANYPLDTPIPAVSLPAGAQNVPQALVPDGISTFFVDTNSQAGNLGIVIALPDATTCRGRRVAIKDNTGVSNLDGDNKQIFLAPAVADQSIDQYDQANPYGLNPWECRWVESDGVNWKLV